MRILFDLVGTLALFFFGLPLMDSSVQWWIRVVKDEWGWWKENKRILGDREEQ